MQQFILQKQNFFIKFVKKCILIVHLFAIQINTLTKIESNPNQFRIIDELPDQCRR